jgi:uncharacterized protein (DUF1800 family)
MPMNRRGLLRAAALGAGALASCDRVVTRLNQEFLGEGVPAKLDLAGGAEVDADFHLLSRAAFGPWPGDVGRVKAMGREAWLEEQLHPERISDTACDLRAERFESLYFSAGDAYEFRKPVLRDEITRHALLRAIYSRRQLFEVMVEFWTDHLNIDLEKGDCIYLKPSDDREVIRKHALGNFYDLIRASATSPAMLVYLDGKSNKVRRKTDDKPNENYARELMELHTLGVHGGYTQLDVLEAARCLSGWTFDRERFFAMNAGESFFKADWHDEGEKRVLGRVIPGRGSAGREAYDGREDLDRLVEIVCGHASTARFIATKLCRRFVAVEPPVAVVEAVAAAFTRTRGDIKAMLRVLFGSEAFAASRGGLLKRPFKFMVSALRALAADTQAEKAVLEPLQRMGHGLFQYPTPDGYPDEELPWMGTLMWRWNFALALAAGKQAGVRVDLRTLRRAFGPQAGAEAWFRHLVGRAPTAEEVAAVTGGTDEQTVGLILASPAFQRC